MTLNFLAYTAQSSAELKSIISSEDFDCQNKQIKTVSSKYFSDNKGAGVEVDNSESANYPLIRTISHTTNLELGS